MSCQPCGCDPEARHHCGDYPHCAWGRVEARELKWVNTETGEQGSIKPTSMTLQSFQSSIARTYRPNNPACHGLGIAGEAGEVADIIKKVLFHTSGDIDLLTSGRRDDMRLELGDVLWYVAAVASDWGFTLDEVANANIDKLAKRYPNGLVKGGGVREPRESGATDCLFKQALGWRCTRGVHSAGDPCALVSVPVSDAEVTTARAIRLPKQTFRAIRNQFRRFDRSIDTQMYPGRPTMCVCASVFEEGDE